MHELKTSSLGEWLLMEEVTRHKLIWGWVRLFLGFTQMSLVAASVGALLTVGLHWITYTFVIAATVATLTSRLLYRGKADLKPESPKREYPKATK